MTWCSRDVVVFGAILTLACAAGCSGAGNGTVSGEVTLDGKPLKQGVIRFVPVDGKSPPAEAPIADGRYSATVPVGDKRVEVSSSKVVGKVKMYDTPDSPVVEDTAETLLPRYNVNSELRMTVQSGSQEKKFDLKSK